MKNNKTAFVTFFPINPNNMGSSTVVNSRFRRSNWSTVQTVVRFTKNTYDTAHDSIFKLPFPLRFNIIYHIKLYSGSQYQLTTTHQVVVVVV